MDYWAIMDSFENFKNNWKDSIITQKEFDL